MYSRCSTAARRRPRLSGLISILAALAAGATLAQTPTPSPLRSPFPDDAPEATVDYLHVPGSGFVPMHSDSGVVYQPWGCTYLTGPETSTNFAVVLPHGSTVTYLRLYWADTSAASDGHMRFASYNDGFGGVYLEELFTSGSAGFGTTTLSGLSHVIDNVNNSYVLYWSTPVLTSAIQLCGFRVGFIEPRIFTDGFEIGNTSNWTLTTP